MGCLECAARLLDYNVNCIIPPLGVPVGGSARRGPSSARSGDSSPMDLTDDRRFPPSPDPRRGASGRPPLGVVGTCRRFRQHRGLPCLSVHGRAGRSRGVLSVEPGAPGASRRGHVRLPARAVGLPSSGCAGGVRTSGRRETAHPRVGRPTEPGPAVVDHLPARRVRPGAMGPRGGPHGTVAHAGVEVEGGTRRRGPLGRDAGRETPPVPGSDVRPLCRASDA